MADVNVQAIQGNPPKVIDPLTMMSGWQDYANKRAQNRQIEQEIENSAQTNRKTEEEMTRKRVDFMAPKFGALLAKPKGTITEQDMHGLLNNGYKQGYLTREDVSAAYDEIPKGGTDEQFREVLTRRLVGGLAAKDALDALSTDVKDTDVGGKNVARVTPSKANRLSGAPATITTAPGSGQIRSLAPQTVDAGGTVETRGGTGGEEPVEKTLSPRDATTLQPRTYKDEKTGQIVTDEKPLSERYPHLTTPKTQLGSGGYPQVPASKIPMGTEKDIEASTKLRGEHLAEVPDHIKAARHMSEALNGLNAVATGAGTEGLARMRAVATSWANVLGIPLPEGLATADKDKQRAILEAHLNKFVLETMMSSTRGSQTEKEQMLTKLTGPSGVINNAAAQHLARQVIGERLAAAAAPQELKNGQTYREDLAKWNASTINTVGFAWDTYEKSEKREIVERIKKGGGDVEAALDALSKSIEVGRRMTTNHGIRLFNPDSNVNANR